MFRHFSQTTVRSNKGLIKVLIKDVQDVLDAEITSRQAELAKTLQRSVHILLQSGKETDKARLQAALEYLQADLKFFQHGEAIKMLMKVPSPRKSDPSIRGEWKRVVQVFVVDFNKMLSLRMRTKLRCYRLTVFAPLEDVTWSERLAMLGSNSGVLLSTAILWPAAKLGQRVVRPTRRTT